MGADSVKNKVAEITEMPSDIILDAPRVTIIGNFELGIENHRGLIEYNDNCVRVNTSIGVFKLTGSNLSIKNIDLEEIVITGSIENIDISS